MVVPPTLFALAVVFLLVLAPSDGSCHPGSCCTVGANRTCCLPSAGPCMEQTLGVALLFASVISLPLAFAFRWSRRYLPLPAELLPGPAAGPGKAPDAPGPSR